jgi:hypothetical protein
MTTDTSMRFGPAPGWLGRRRQTHLSWPEPMCSISRAPRRKDDDPGTDATVLVARVDFDAGQVDLPGTVIDIQHADIGLPSVDDLPSARVEGALMERALDLLVPPQIAVMYSPMAALCSW